MPVGRYVLRPTLNILIDSHRISMRADKGRLGEREFQPFGLYLMEAPLADLLILGVILSGSTLDNNFGKEDRSVHSSACARDTEPLFDLIL